MKFNSTENCVFTLLLEILDFNRPILLQIPVHRLDAVLGSYVFHRGQFRVVQKVICFLLKTMQPYTHACWNFGF